MDKFKIIEKVREIIVDSIDILEEQVSLDSHVSNDLDITDVGLFLLLIDIEEEFDIRIPDGEDEKVGTIGDLVDLVEQKLKEKQ